MKRPQFSLKTLLWSVALASVFCFGFVAGGGRERRQLEVERVRLRDQSFDLSVRENRIIAKEKSLGIEWCGTR